MEAPRPRLVWVHRVHDAKVPAQALVPKPVLARHRRQGAANLSCPAKGSGIGQRQQYASEELFGQVEQVVMEANRSFPCHAALLQLCHLCHVRSKANAAKETPSQ